MAGVIVADTLQDGAGNSTAMDNAIYGSAKAWVNYNGVGQSIRASYNVSSVTYITTGQYRINLTNAMVDANGCAVGSSSQNGNASDNGRGICAAVASSSTINVGAFATNNNTQTDQSFIGVAVFR